MKRPPTLPSLSKPPQANKQPRKQPVVNKGKRVTAIGKAAVTQQKRQRLPPQTEEKHAVQQPVEHKDDVICEAVQPKEKEKQVEEETPVVTKSALPAISQTEIPGRPSASSHTNTVVATRKQTIRLALPAPRTRQAQRAAE